MRDLIQFEGEVQAFLTMRDVKDYLSSPFAFDNIAVLGPSSYLMSDIIGKPTKMGMRMFQVKETKYTADFTQEGYISAMEYTNPAKYVMIKEGTIKLDKYSIKNVNLYDKAYSTVEDKKYLSHMSTNNTKQAFSKSPRDAEVCLEYVEKGSKEKTRQMVSSLRENLIEYIEMIIKTIGLESQSYEVSNSNNYQL